MRVEPRVANNEPKSGPPTQANPQNTAPITALDLERCNGCPPMVFVQGGTFTMGCTEEQGSDCRETEKPAHQVTVPDFYIGKYEVTQAEWEAVIGDNPSRFKDCPRCPVESVSWDDVQEFIKKLNTKTGKNFRLPSEAEWEYAARGGQKTKKFKYAGDTKNLGLVAWWDGNSGNKIHPVGERKANELGLYDMSGNVWEWCADTWHADYTGASVDGSVWEEAMSSEASRVYRGGSWGSPAQYCRAACRGLNDPAFRWITLGFRLVLPLQ
jgi:formylglycine-generating enzyme required for sulfatase activity